jgi:hypothetical protein
MRPRIPDVAIARPSFAASGMPGGARWLIQATKRPAYAFLAATGTGTPAILTLTLQSALRVVK